VATPKEYTEDETAMLSIDKYKADMAFDGVSFVGVLTLPIGEDYGKPVVIVNYNDSSYSEEINESVSPSNYMKEYFDNIRINATGGKITFTFNKIDNKMNSSTTINLNGMTVENAYVVVSHDDEELWRAKSHIEDDFWVCQLSSSDGHFFIGYSNSFFPDKVWFEVSDEYGFIYRWLFSGSGTSNSLDEISNFGDLLPGIVYDKTGTKVMVNF